MLSANKNSQLRTDDYFIADEIPDMVVAKLHLGTLTVMRFLSGRVLFQANFTVPNHEQADMGM
jgi:hypothetical protein